MASGKVITVLGIGNSFTFNANTWREALNDADPGCRLEMTLAWIGGCSLEKHYRLAMMHEKHPRSIHGKPYDGKSLRELLEAQSWDVVTIQQYSMLCTDPDTYRPHARNLCEYIRKYCPGAEIVMHETWAYRSDDPQFGPDGGTDGDMYRRLHAAYRTIADELGIRRVIPSGSAFMNALERPDWQYRPDAEFDFAHAVAPALPVQTHSLHAGWSWARDAGGRDTLKLDAHHAGTAGEFLAALVWREFLLDLDVRDNSGCPPSLAAADAAILREVAHATVHGGLLPQSLNPTR